MNNVSFPLAFLAGLVSFISPCVLPLIPGYVSFITGVAPQDKPKSFMQTLIPLILFVAGFTLVFTALGASATIIGQFLKTNKFWLTKIAGAAIILMGLALSGVLKTGLMEKSNQEIMERARGGSSFIMGLAFAIGWTPCIGVVLSGILLYASTASTASLGSRLLLTYSLGLGVPFIIFGQAFAVAKYRIGWLKNHQETINKVSGLLLIIMGSLLFADKIGLIAAYMQKVLPKWKFL